MRSTSELQFTIQSFSIRGGITRCEIVLTEFNPVREMRFVENSEQVRGFQYRRMQTDRRVGVAALRGFASAGFVNMHRQQSHLPARAITRQPLNYAARRL